MNNCPPIMSCDTSTWSATGTIQLFVSAYADSKFSEEENKYFTSFCDILCNQWCEHVAYQTFAWSCGPPRSLSWVLDGHKLGSYGVFSFPHPCCSRRDSLVWCNAGHRPAGKTGDDISLSINLFLELRLNHIGGNRFLKALHFSFAPKQLPWVFDSCPCNSPWPFPHTYQKEKELNR